MGSEFLVWTGYIASGIIAFSMTLNSIVKFRWINLIGAFSFATYGFLIGAFPVMVLNSFIVVVDLYYLYRIYNKKELFDILEISGDNKYLIKFLDFHKEEINDYFPGFSFKAELNTLSFFILRNTAVAGIFLARRENNNTLYVSLDFVVPEYRDYKNGKYIYHRLKERFIKAGYHKIYSSPKSKAYTKYLLKMGFIKNSNGNYEKTMLNKY